MSDRKKAVRVWSCDRKIRHGIVAGSWTELLSKIEDKFGYAGTPFSLVLEEDGTIVDEEFWPSVAPQQRLLTLRGGEGWGPPSLPLQLIMPDILGGSQGDTTDAAMGSSASHAFQQLQSNPAAIALLSTDQLALLKDFDLDEVDGLDVELCRTIQDMSIELWVKKKTEEEALEFVELLRQKLPRS